MSSDHDPLKEQNTPAAEKENKISNRTEPLDDISESELEDVSGGMSTVSVGVTWSR